MNHKNAIEALNENIRLMEIEQAKALVSLKEQLHVTGELLTPAGFIRNMLKPSAPEADVKINVLDAVIGIATGFLTKKVLLGSTHNPLMNIAGTILQAGVATFVSQHPDPIKNAASKLIDRIFTKKDKQEKNEDETTEKLKNE